MKIIIIEEQNPNEMTLATLVNNKPEDYFMLFRSDMNELFIYVGWDCIIVNINGSHIDNIDMNNYKDYLRFIKKFNIEHMWAFRSSNGFYEQLTIELNKMGFNNNIKGQG